MTLAASGQPATEVLGCHAKWYNGLIAGKQFVQDCSELPVRKVSDQGHWSKACQSAAGDPLGQERDSNLDRVVAVGCLHRFAHEKFVLQHGSGERVAGGELHSPDDDHAIDVAARPRRAALKWPRPCCSGPGPGDDRPSSGLSAGRHRGMPGAGGAEVAGAVQVDVTFLVCPMLV
jgi:hypothetical protein